MDNGAGTTWIIEDASNGFQNAGKAVATFSKYADKLAIATNTIRVGVSVYEDYNNGTTRNTVETVASIAGGCLGGFAGGLGGAAVGNVILPGIGTIVGRSIGSLGGGIAGSLGARATAEAIGDALEYDVEEKVCDKCGKKFKVRKYKGERSQICPKCSGPFKVA